MCIVAFLPISAETYQLAAPALLPIWLGLTAPLLLSLGLAPARKAPAPKAKRKKKRRSSPRKAAAKKAGATVLPFAKKA